jgi:zinc-ribbon domain
MYCPTCGNEITVEVKYCNRCGANLSLIPSPPQIVAPVKLTAPTVVIGLTITIGLGIIFAGARELGEISVHPTAITWMALFGLATLFGCSAMLIRFWSKMMELPRQPAPPQEARPKVKRGKPEQLPAPLEPVPSVTEHTTRTFAPAYREPSERGPQ